MNKQTVKGYLFAIASAVIYGSMPLMANFLYADGVSPFALVFLRNFFSLVPLAGLAYHQSKTLKVPKDQLPKLCLISVLGCCVTPILLFCSYQFIPSGTATVFHFAYPAFVVIGGGIFLRKQIQRGNLFCVLLCIGGIALFYDPRQPVNFTGSLLALSSGITFAAYIILLSRFRSSKIPIFLFSFYVTLISSIVSFAVCLFTDRLMLPTSLAGWGMCVLFSLLVTVGAVVLFQQSAFLIGGERCSVLSTLEPITSLLIGVLILKEQAGLSALIGSALVVAASILTALFDIRAKKGKSPPQ